MEAQQLNQLWQEYQATQQPDVNALWNEYQSTKQTPQITQEQPAGFFSRTEADWTKRNQQLSDIGNREQSLGSTGLQVAGNLAGRGVDLIGNTAGSIMRQGRDIVTDPSINTVFLGGAASPKGQAVQQQIGDIGRQGLGYLADTQLGQLAKQGVRAYGNFEQSHPITAADIGAIGNIASVIPLAKPATAIGGELLAAGKTVASAPVKGISNMAKGFVARDADELAVAGDVIRQGSNQAYQAMRNAGTVINRSRAVNITNQVEKAIQATGKLNAGLHGKTLSVLDDFKQAARSGEMGIEELDQYRQLFKDVINSDTDVAGKLGPDAFKSVNAINKIDDAVDKLTGIDIKGGNIDAIGALNTGRIEYARARKFEMISDIVRKSDGDANYLKRELLKLSNNPKKTRGFSFAERQALKQAAKLSAAEALLKIAGKFGFDASRLGTGVGAGVGSAVGFGLGGGLTGAAAVPIAGTAARYGAKLLARGKTENLLRTIEARP